MDSSDVVEEFINMVYRDKKRKHYLEDISAYYKDEDMVTVNELPDGSFDVVIHFIPFVPASKNKLKDNTYYEVKCVDCYKPSKHGIIHLPEDIPLYVTTPSGYTYDSEYDVVEKNNRLITDSFMKLRRKANPSPAEKTLIKEVNSALYRVREDIRKSEEAYNYYNKLRSLYEAKFSVPNLNGKRTSPIRVNIRKMF